MEHEGDNYTNLIDAFGIVTNTPLRVRVNFGVMSVRQYSTLLRSPELEPHQQTKFSVIQRAPWIKR